MASVIRIEQFERTGGGRPDHRARDGVRSERRSVFQPRDALDTVGSLSRLIEREIIPRLLVAHAAPPAPAALSLVCDGGISVGEVAAFAPLALHVEADELLDHVDALLARGVSLETVLVDLLAPAARLLGQFWEEDRCDFVDVTMGLWRLQEVVHDLAGRTPQAPYRAGPVRRALFATFEGDQHSFGTVVIDELFCAHGWRTDRLTAATTAEVVERVRNDWFDLAGLTITCDCHIAPLSSIVRRIRAASRNPRICVMVGGRVFALDADLAAAVGADGTAPDARIALRVAGELVDAVAREAVVPMTG
jgi:methanogenic corrinoid protein MtbC1